MSVLSNISASVAGNAVEYVAKTQEVHDLAKMEFVQVAPTNLAPANERTFNVAPANTLS